MLYYPELMKAINALPKYSVLINYDQYECTYEYTYKCPKLSIKDISKLKEMNKISSLCLNEIIIDEHDVSCIIIFSYCYTSLKSSEKMKKDKDNYFKITVKK